MDRSAAYENPRADYFSRDQCEKVTTGLYTFTNLTGCFRFLRAEGEFEFSMNGRILYMRPLDAVTCYELHEERALSESATTSLRGA